MSEERTSLAGVGATPRSGVGTAVRYAPDDALDLDDATSADVDPETERDRYEAAVEGAKADLERERERTAAEVGEQEAAVFDAHVKFLEDPQITDAVEEAIEDGHGAEHAVRNAFEDPIEQFEGMDGRMGERADDLRDVRDRLLRELLGTERTGLAELDPGSVVVAERLTPSDTARLDPDDIVGIATAEGGRTSHAAIIARSLAIPAVVGVGDALAAVEDGDRVLVDGEDGELVVDPDAERVAAAERDDAADVRRGPVTTTDGRAVEVAANVGGPDELAVAVERGADGVGLYRTEFLFLDRDEPPTEEEQYKAFVDALDAFEGGRVVVRTFDVGGDKSIPYLDVPEGDNPFLGVRGVRLALGSARDLFETQLRALLRAAATEHGDALAVMFPLVATVEELTAALDAVESVAAALDDEGVEHAVPELGVMVETPAAVMNAAELADRVDFLSVGTNDLAQYVQAAARDDDHVADLHDPRYPAVLRAIARTVEAARDADAWVGMCGEMAGVPENAELLVGLGLDELSASAVTVPAVKERVVETTYGDAETLAERARSAETRREVTELVEP
ncbi:phosphoenolpyruvate--protein phosphotransferase [Halomicrococcus sp. NG-SE-24]|uniref:phosphoenolpyruvate--protein phosphotransferase n=1 Tax=Halomicrococcus sp. NG-SE-24 TaxID=3436928 RepID=UPI003D97158F